MTLFAPGRRWESVRLLRAAPLLATILTLSLPAHAQTEYRFERMWPTLEQRWYFQGPSTVATSDSDFVYVLDRDSADDISKLHKFHTSGAFITSWGDKGTGPGQFEFPCSVAVDSSDNVYVVDNGNERIQKYDSNGAFLTQWGGLGDGPGQFNDPRGVAVDPFGNVYIADSNNSRIQKFDSDGAFLTEWAVFAAWDVAADDFGYVFAIAYGGDRVQKFSYDGTFITEWGSFGFDPGQIWHATSVAVDKTGNVYVSDEDFRIHKFDSGGTFLTEWSDSYGAYGPGSVAIDASGYVYATDSGDRRIKKFASGGSLVDQWQSAGIGPGQMDNPFGIAIDTSGNVYVTDQRSRNLVVSYGLSRIQKFDTTGALAAVWNNSGWYQEGTGISVDSFGNVYVADTWNGTISKFNSSGANLDQWNIPGWDINSSLDHLAVDSSGNVYAAVTSNIFKFNSTGTLIWYGGGGSGPGEFSSPSGVTVASDDSIYVADTGNHRIQKLDSMGSFQLEWGTQGSGPGEFQYPYDVAVDSAGNVFVADFGNDRIQCFDSAGGFQAEWGGLGSAPGQFVRPKSLAVDVSGGIYVVDSGNNRIQKFVPTISPTNAKAIVVAAGGAFFGNNLWDATQNAANFAYRALTFQGFTKDRIQYLSSDLDLDLDGNGLADDVDADATNANLQDALENWASDADSLVVYLVDHGGGETFRMGPTELLTASELAPWLNTADTNISGDITVIYDACQSGSFMNSLKGAGRAIITSASGVETAKFSAQGTISFSNFFWEQVFNGNDIETAFTISQQAMASYQSPQLDADGDGIPNEAADLSAVSGKIIGNGTDFNLDKPVIGGPVGIVGGGTLASGSTATIFADNVTDPSVGGSVSRVWAMLRPPNYTEPSPDNPVTGFATVELDAVGGDRFEGTYESFTAEGTYDIVIYALDDNNYTSVPQVTTLAVNNPYRRKAIIAVGADPGSPAWTASEAAAKLAVETLQFQRYEDADLDLFAEQTITGVDNVLTLQLTKSNLESAIAQSAADGQDVLVYLIGPGDTNTFRLNDTESLGADELAGWLNTLQATLPGVVTVLYDGDKTETFADDLAPPPVGKERIFVGSTDDVQRASFIANGAVSYSRFFWPQIFNGATVGQAHGLAVRAISTELKLQNPSLDDNGSGTVNEKIDGALARKHYLGTGILLAGDFPLIGGNTGDQAIGSGTTASFGVSDVTTTGSISRVWATITPPGYTPSAPHLLATVDLSNTSGNDYDGNYGSFTEMGDYQVSIFAKDVDGVVSVPSVLTITQPSDSFTEAPTATELRNNFDGLDSDESQGLTLAEAQVQLPGLTASLFNQLDDDSSGDLSLAELLDGSVGEPGLQDPVYVDFSYAATECGTSAQPFNTLGEGAAFVAPGGTVYVTGGNSGETLVITEGMTIATMSGASVIGVP